MTRMKERTVRPLAIRLRNIPKIGAYTIKEAQYWMIQSAAQLSPSAMVFKMAVLENILSSRCAKDSVPSFAINVDGPRMHT